MTTQNVYDLAVIGAGPAGIVGATTAASLGARVVLIDRFGDLGGAGANTDRHILPAGGRGGGRLRT